MSTVENKLITVAENQQKVYDAGSDKGTYDRDLLIWNMMTCNGKRTEWYDHFRGKDFSNYEFVKPFCPKATDVCQRMFYDYMGQYLPKNLDFSKLQPSTNIDSLFTWATGLLEIYDIGLPAMDRYVWTQTYKLKKIEILRVHEGTTFSWTTLSALEDITFEGVIGQNLNLSSAPKLTHDSLMNIIGCLKDYSSTGTTKTLTLGATNLAKLTDAEKQIATDKGWSLA